MGMVGPRWGAEVAEVPVLSNQCLSPVYLPKPVQYDHNRDLKATKLAICSSRDKGHKVAYQKRPTNFTPNSDIS